MKGTFQVSTFPFQNDVKQLDDHQKATTKPFGTLITSNSQNINRSHLNTQDTMNLNQMCPLRWS